MYRQLALCIGNNDYQYPCLSKLKCAVNDARAISEKLESRGFDILYHSDIDREEMHRAVDEFEEKLVDYDVGLFYFAGHGFEGGGDNLLMPIDTNGSDAGCRGWMALKLDSVINALEGKNNPNDLKTKIIILDACRQNPGNRGRSRLGFAPIFAPEGTIIAFSTSPGQIANESDVHGLYTRALLQSIDIPRIPIENMFKHVRETIAVESNREQIPWEHTSLMGNYYFNEDRIDSGCIYSSEAFVDKEYYFKTDNAVGVVVEKLRSHDWYTQNPAINEVGNLQFDQASANDLFVLGRNIYQAAEGNARDARRFIDDFSSLKRIPVTAKEHILNGMAYEIYFNSSGLPRQIFKTKCYIEILKLLEMELFQVCRSFIAEKIQNLSDSILYIPGSEERIELYLMCHTELVSDGETIFIIESINLHGKNILFDYEGEEIKIVQPTFLIQTYKQVGLRSVIAKDLVAPPDMLVLSYNIEITDRSQFAFPGYYSLRNKALEK